MTVKEIKNQVFLYFCNNQSSSFNDLFSEIENNNLTVESEILKEVLYYALLDFEKADLLIGVTSNPLEKQKINAFKDYWVVVSPFNQYKQTIELSGETIVAIESIINKYCKKYNDSENLCDSLSISEKDIVNLIKLVLTLEEAAGINTETEIEEDEDDD